MKKDAKNFKIFGEHLRSLREKEGLSLREICKKVNYDPSNWSKIERGVMSPPGDKEILKHWAAALGLKANSTEYNDFIDESDIAQGIIPDYILNDAELLNHLPAFFRTLGNEKPTKQEIDNLINLLKKS